MPAAVLKRMYGTDQGRSALENKEEALRVCNANTCPHQRIELGAVEDQSLSLYRDVNGSTCLRRVNTLSFNVKRPALTQICSA